MIFEISGSHSGVAEVSTLVGCDAVSTGKQYVAEGRIALIFTVKQSKNCRTCWIGPCGCRYYDPSKRRRQFTNLRCVTSQKMNLQKVMYYEVNASVISGYLVSALRACL